MPPLQENGWQCGLTVGMLLAQLPSADGLTRRVSVGRRFPLKSRCVGAGRRP